MHPFEQKEPELAEKVRAVIEAGQGKGEYTFRDRNPGQWKLGTEGLDFIRQALAPHRQDIRALSFPGCGLTDADMSSLASILRDAPNLTSLSLWSNHITHQGLPALIQEAAEKPGLKELFLDHNPIGSEGGTALAGLLHSCPRLRRLSLSSCSLEDEGVRQVTKAVGSSRTLRDINLGWNRTTFQGMEDMVDMLRQNRSLTQASVNPGIINTPESEKEEIRRSQEYLFDAAAGLSHPNLLNYYPHRGLDPFIVRNEAEVKRLTPFLSEDLATLPHGVLDAICNREGAVFHTMEEQVRQMERAVGKEEEAREARKSYEATEGRYEAFMEELPRLPEAGKDFCDALFKADSQGFAPLDHPRLYQQGTSLLERLQASGQPLTKELLSRRTERGASLMEAVAKAVTDGGRLTVFLKETRTVLREKELLDEEGKPSPLLERFIDSGTVPCLFTPDNWLGSDTGEMHRVYDALPPHQQQQIALQSLKVELGRNTPLPARGR